MNKSAPTGFDYRIKIVSLWDSRYFDFSDEVIKITGTPSSSVSHDLWTLYQ